MIINPGLFNCELTQKHLLKRKIARNLNDRSIDKESIKNSPNRDSLPATVNKNGNKYTYLYCMQ